MNYYKKLIDLKTSNQKIAIFGLGQENRQFLFWLLDSINYPIESILLFDEGLDLDKFLELFSQEFQLDLIGKLPKENLFFDKKCLKQIKNSEISWVFKSPGIWSLKPEFVNLRKKYGNWFVTSGLVFFVEKYRNQIIGVTGTKGKTTTSSMLVHLLDGFKQNNYKAHYCGNTTGISPYKYWTNQDNLDLENNLNLKTKNKQGLDEIFVVELSSFQLQDLGFAKISPKYALITNYFVDHLDQHGSVQEYWHSKDQIFSHQETTDYFFAYQQIWDNITNRENFSLDGVEIQTAIKQEISSSADQTAWINDSKTDFENDQSNNQFSSKYPDKSFLIKDDFFNLNKVFSLKLAGIHNFQNLILALFAFAVINLEYLIKKEDNNFLSLPNKKEQVSVSHYQDSKNISFSNLTADNKNHNFQENQADFKINKNQIINYLQLNKTEIQILINAFQAVEHRLELFNKTNINGVEFNFYDDGASTQPESTAACIESLTQNQNLILFITGKDKGGQATVLVKQIISSQKNIIKIYACSEVGKNFLKEIKAELFKNNQTDLLEKVIYYESFKSAALDFSKIIKTTSLEQTIFGKNISNYKTINICMSPGGSSFDEFDNYKQRSCFWQNLFKP